MDAHLFGVADLDRISRLWDAAVDVTPGVDVFCSSSPWSFAAATSFPDVSSPVLVGNDDAFCGMRATSTVDGTTVLVGLDPIWGFATPLVGPPDPAAAMLAFRLSLERFDAAVIAAQRTDGELTLAVARALGRAYRLFQGPVEHRLRIDLSDGFGPWFERRSPRFRQRLRRIRRDAASHGVEIDDARDTAPDAMFARLLAIEDRSWKGRDDTGLANGDLAHFYRTMAGHLARSGDLRVLVAQVDGRDIGYILGGVRGGTYRGLQLSHDRELTHLGLGHLLQYCQIERLVEEGIALYDLGMDMDYKRRWADRSDETVSIVLRR